MCKKARAVREDSSCFHLGIYPTKNFTRERMVATYSRDAARRVFFRYNHQSLIILLNFRVLQKDIKKIPRRHDE